MAADAVQPAANPSQPDSGSTIPRDKPEPDERRRKLVADWASKVKHAKTKWEKTLKKMVRDQKFCAGAQWPEETKIAAFNDDFHDLYVANITLAARQAAGRGGLRQESEGDRENPTANPVDRVGRDDPGAHPGATDAADATGGDGRPAKAGNGARLGHGDGAGRLNGGAGGPPGGTSGRPRRLFGDFGRQARVLLAVAHCRNASGSAWRAQSGRQPDGNASRHSQASNR